MSFQSSGSMFHIFGPKNETLYVDFTSGLENLEIDLKLY